MAIASILGVLSGEADSADALKTALACGKAFEAHVTILHAPIDPTRSLPLLGEGMTGAVISDLSASIAAEGERTRKTVEQLFERHCRVPDIPIVPFDEMPPPQQFSVSLNIASGIESEVVGEEGRLCDLLVLARPTVEEGTTGPTLEAALFDTGRPVLMAPRGGLDHLPRRMAIAWNGTREASRAVALSIPVLRKAKEVVVISGEGKEDRPIAHPTALKRYLAAQGIESETWRYLPEDWPIANSLVEQAKKAGAGLLVMGAYGHSRLRELVVGGATRAALKADDLATVLVH